MARCSLVIQLCFTHFFVCLNDNFVCGNFCETNKDCVSAYRQFCCRNRPNLRRRCRANCIGQYCTSDSDCYGRNECCGVLNQCTTYGCPSECKANYNCNSGTYCCQKRKITEKSVCLPSCVGEFCRSDTDCGGPHECCSLLNHCTTHGCRHECVANEDCSNNTVCCIKGHSFDKNSCKDSCLGESCQSDKDCGKIGLCCGLDYFCTDKCNVFNSKRLGAWIIATIVISVLLAILLVGILAAYLFRVSRQKQKSSDRDPGILHMVKDPTLPMDSKPRNTYRRPSPLRSPKMSVTFARMTSQSKNVQPVLPDRTPTSKNPPEFQEESDQSSSSSRKTLNKVRRKPPSPPRTDTSEVQQDLSPGKSKRPPPRPPSLPQKSDKRVTFKTVSIERRPPPLPPV